MQLVRRISTSNLGSKLRQLQSKRRQAFSSFKQATNNLMRVQRERVRKLNSAIDRYNAAVRVHNNRTRAHQTRLNRAVAALRANSAPRYFKYRTSVLQLTENYERLEAAAETRRLSNQENYLLDLSEKEAANSASTLNALEQDGQQNEANDDGSDLQTSIIDDEIFSISDELDRRWRGALFSLSPKNPEASRHFCTSVREIFTGILEIAAPDSEVELAIPNCPRTPQGGVSRRAKMGFLLREKGVVNEYLTAFADDDINNVVALFDELNGATHGPSGKLGLTALREIKRRVEDSLIFLCQIAA